MGLKQSNIFGGYEPVNKKNGGKSAGNIRKPPIKKVNEKLKQKVNELYSLYEELYNRLYDRQYINLLDMMLETKTIDNRIIVYPDEQQAEPKDIANLTLYDIDERINKMRETLEDFK